MDNKKKFSLDVLFADRRFTAALSLVLAILVWLFVITVVDPDQTAKRQVKVSFDYNSATYTSRGLDILHRPEKTITVEIAGDNSVLGGVTAKDLLVYPDYSTVEGPGNYKLKLKIEKANPLANYTINDPGDQYIDVTFDKVVTQKMPITVNASGIQPADGYFMDTAVASPKEVTISGPERDIARVDKVVANVQLNEERTESAIANATLTYVDKNGEEIRNASITCDVAQVEVTIPILKIKELPITVEYSSVPAGYDTTQLGATLSQKTIRVAGPAEQVDALTDYKCYVNLSSFKLGESVQCNIELTDGLRNIDSLQTVTVSFNTIGYTVKTITVTELYAANVASNMTVSFPTARVNNVTLIGKESELQTLASTSVVAQVDATPANISVMNGQQTMPVKIIVPGTQTVFATGSYTVLCEISTRDVG